jgi:signal transduction histidine kinase
LKAADAAATDLWLRAVNFMKQMARHYPSMGFAITGEAPADMPVPSGRALNVLLVLQEAVSNAVKHANATVITANSSWEKGKWQLTVSDNGIGFEMAAAAAKKDSYGLRNMQERATAAAIALQISSEPGQGTVVTILV